MKVLFIAGPTASGKSDLALSLAEKFQGEILNCDSIQCYQRINLGSAKPSAEEFNRVPHHLFDFVTPPDEITAGRYLLLAEKKLAELKKNNCPLAIVVGGTGFYLQALEKGMYSTGPVDAEVLVKIEAELASGGAEKLWQELNQVDPQTAEKISLNDHYRLGRALEIYRGHKRIPSEVRKEFREQQRPFAYPLAKVRLRCERDWLEARVQRRVQSWIRQGWIEEVENMLEDGLKNWAPLSSVGFLEIQQQLLGETNLPLKDLEALIVTRTMQLAKKQRTWFQRDTEMHILDASDPDNCLSQVQKTLSILFEAHTNKHTTS